MENLTSLACTSLSLLVSACCRPGRSTRYPVSALFHEGSWPAPRHSLRGITLYDVHVSLGSAEVAAESPDRRKQVIVGVFGTLAGQWLNNGPSTEIGS